MKRLVVCCDGTWCKFEAKINGLDTPTNVVRFARAVKPVADDGTTQLVFYNQGIGTGRFLDRFWGGVFGMGLSDKILEAYRFLVLNYEPGDELFLLGYSRGAYSVRSLAGLIRNSGILTKHYAGYVNEAYELYRDRNDDCAPNSQRSRQFRAHYSHEPRIKFIGVWDTVGALGIPIPRLKWFGRSKFDFHDTKLSSYVDYAYQAIAVDEKRKLYRAALWQRDPGDDNVLEQAWFTGVHSNIGGGMTRVGLSLIAFRWMCERAESYLDLDEAYINHLDPYPEDNYKLPFNDNPGFWGMLGKQVRPIGVVDNGQELIHTSTKQRLEAEHCCYQPANVIEALARQVPVES